MRGVVVILLVLPLVACGSSPRTRFYTLEPVPPSAAPFSAPQAPVTVGKVTTPAVLDRLSLVSGDGPERLDISDQDRWAAPLAGMIRRVLAADLAARLGPGRMLAPGDPVPPGPVLAVTVNLREFRGSTTGRVTLAGDWSVLDARQQVVLTEPVLVTSQTASGQADSIVGGMSQALGQLSDRIARRIGELGPS